MTTKSLLHTLSGILFEKMEGSQAFAGTVSSPLPALQ